MNNTQAAMKRVTEIEEQEKAQAEAQVIPGPGHNNPPGSIHDVNKERLARAAEIHRETKDLSTVQLDQEIAEDRAMIRQLHSQIGLQESLAKEELEREETVHDTHRGMLEGELAEAKARRDEQIAAYTAEIAAIETRLTEAKDAHEVKKGQIIRHNQDQIASMKRRIARRERALEAGMVSTVEPGLYIAAGTEGVDERWWNIGIRIEDDVLVTDEGNEVMTAGVPKGADEIVATMQGGS